MTAMAGRKPKHFLWQVEGRVAKDPARPAGAQEPADLRQLCRIARHVPRPRLCRRRRCRGVPAQWRQFLLGRRCPRHHRPAGQDGHEGAARLHPHDRRFRQGDAELRQADHRGGRRRGGRRRRHHRHGLRHPHRHAGGEDGVPVHARRPCRLRHGRLRDPAAHHRPGPCRRTALHRPHDDVLPKASAGGSTTGWSMPRRSRPTRWRWQRASSPARPSRTASPRRSSTRNGRWGSTRRSRRKRRRRRSACRRGDFERAYKAFVAKEKPVFEGN